MKKNPKFEYMNTHDIIQYLKSQNKPYAQLSPPMPQSTFSNTIRAIEAGNCNVKTMRHFFAKFGYEFVCVTWNKVD